MNDSIEDKIIERLKIELKSVKENYINDTRFLEIALNMSGNSEQLKELAFEQINKYGLLKAFKNSFKKNKKSVNNC